MAADVKLSIIIPAYNYAHYLPRVLDSVLTQLAKTDELVVVDDASSDNTLDVLQQYKNQYPEQIKIVQHQKNCGVAAARNNGVSHVSNDYVIFLDSDDNLLDGALATWREVALQHQDSDFMLFAANHHTVRDDKKAKERKGKAFSKFKIENFRRHIFKEIQIPNGSFMAKRSIFEKVQYPESIANVEDPVFFAHVLANYNCLHVDAFVVAIYHHADSLRHHETHNFETGLKTVDLIFDPKHLPAECMRYKKPYQARRLISLARHALRCGKKPEAKNYMKQAMQVYPRCLLSWRAIKTLCRV